MCRRFVTIAAVSLVLTGVPLSAESTEWARLAQVKKPALASNSTNQQAQPLIQPVKRSPLAPPEAAQPRQGSLARPVRRTAPPQPKAYTHPKVGYALVVPPGVEVVERKKGKQLSLRARKGYVINIQTGPKRPNIPLSRMSALLEEKYLGAGKPWAARGAENALQVGGLPAFNVLYEGSASKTRVVVARGDTNDYVMIFIAPERAFKKLEKEFEWILSNFRPGPKDLASPTRHLSKAKTDSTQRFSEPGYGYVIDYPTDWEMTKPANMATMFSGREGTPAYSALIGVQNIAPPGANGPEEAAARAFNQLKSSLGNAVRRFTIVGDQAWTYRRGQTNLAGRLLEATYVHGRETFRKRIIVVARPNGTVAHVWSYTAPQRQFAVLQPFAERMLQSWTILTDGRQ